jgi:hypothetical protein
MCPRSSRKCARVIAKITNPTGMRVTQLLLEVESVLAATDVRNLAGAAKAAAKLAEIDRQLTSLSGNGWLEKARLYVKEQLKKLKIASIEAVWSSLQNGDPRAGPFQPPRGFFVSHSRRRRSWTRRVPARTVP